MTQRGNAPVVIVGGGLAGISFANTLRTGGYEGPLTLICEEIETPYDRPPLSKGFLKDGNAQLIRLDMSRVSDATVLSGVTAQELNLAAHTLRLSDGSELPWGTLVLATGARARTLPELAVMNRPLFTLRTIDDARQIREQLHSGCRVLLVGAGVISLELAATARELGAEVTVVETQQRVMARSVPATLSKFVLGRHQAAGVNVQLGRKIMSCFEGGVQLDDGMRIEADLVITGIGVLSNDEIARKAGIRCDDGVFVDGHSHSSAPGVLAVGDVARQLEPVSGQVMRIETWSNAHSQAEAAARAWLDGTSPIYADAPWFWSDQYELRIQGVGVPTGEREVIRGDLGTNCFALLQLNGRRLVGATCVNKGKDFGALRRMVGREFDASDVEWASLPNLHKLT